MNIDPALLQLMQRMPQHPSTQWGPLKQILQAQREAVYTRPGQPGIIPPQQEPNMPVIDPNQLMMDQAAKQSGEQPDYLPPIPENIHDPNKERMGNMLRLLENYQRWKQGERH